MSDFASRLPASLALDRLVQAFLFATLFACGAYAQSESAIAGRWGRNGLTQLELEADVSGAVAGNAYFQGAGAPVRMPISAGRFDRARGVLQLEGELTLPGCTARTTWTLRGTLVEPTLNVDLIMGATRNSAALTRLPPPQALGPGTVLITGANRGLGLEFARQYAARGWTVIATARNPDKASDLRELARSSGVTIERLDVLDRAAITALAARYEGAPIDLLINNAGIGGDPALQSLGAFDYELFEEAMAVNVYGPLAVAEAFLPNVIASRHKKIVAITSGWGIFSLPRPPGPYFYRASKAALNMAMHTLATDLRDEQIIVGLVAPGAADTDLRRQLQGNSNAPTAAEAAAATIKVIDGLTLENSRQPINFDGSVLPW
jgi:NAD(P)-dependent dehydrogenase (short-subunit alcohol dehydrogenase family)